MRCKPSSPRGWAISTLAPYGAPARRDLHLNGSRAEMSGEIAPVAGSAEVPSGPMAAGDAGDCRR
jgi:hypothetical protein